MKNLKPIIVFVGLGSNIANPLNQVTVGIKLISSLVGCTLLKRSSIYVSQPEGGIEQPSYLNAVIMIRTLLDPMELLQKLQTIESERGRVRNKKNASRTLDLDILLFGELEIKLPDLIVPHPRMHLREFVLLPLIEIDAGIFINGRGFARELLQTTPSLGTKKFNGK